MKKSVQFIKNEDGAVTVDWVVMTAAVVALAIVTIAVVKEAAIDPADGIGAQIANMATDE